MMSDAVHRLALNAAHVSAVVNCPSDRDKSIRSQRFTHHQTCDRLIPTTPLLGNLKPLRAQRQLGGGGTSLHLQQEQDAEQLHLLLSHVCIGTAPLSSEDFCVRRRRKLRVGLTNDEFHRPELH